MKAHTIRSAVLAGTALVATLTGCAEEAGSGAAPGPAEGTAIPMPSEGLLREGTYLVDAPGWTVAGYTVTVPYGWVATDGPDLRKNREAPTELRIAPTVVEQVYADACEGEDHTGDTAVKVGTGTDALIAALRDQGHGAEVSEPVETQVGDLPATRVELTIPPGTDLSDCRVPGFVQLWHQPGPGYLAIPAGGHASVYILDVDGKRQVFVTAAEPEATRTDKAQLQQILDSIEFGS